jgi:GT2 family glycosyltransferase
MQVMDWRGRLGRSAEFAIEESEEEVFFVHSSGRKIQTDIIGRSIWEALPGEAKFIVWDVQSKQVISAELLERYLFVLLKAGIIESLPPEETERSGGTSDLTENSSPGGELVSAIIITHNGQDHVGECLDSLFGQTYRDLEVIVVDNASTDRTAELIVEKYPEVRIFRLRKNRHFAGAVNIGIKKAKGRYFLVLNQDLALEKDCLAHLCRRMRSDDRIGATAPMMKFYHLRHFINGIGNHIRNTGWGSDNFIGLVDIGQFDRQSESPSACFGAALLNRKAVDDVGVLDSGYGSFYEDVDWCFRSWFKGWKIVPAPDAVIYHKFGVSYLPGRKLRFIVRNRIRLILKTFQGRIMLGFLRRYIQEDIKSLLYFLRREDKAFLAYLESYILLVLSLPHILFLRWRILKGKLRDIREQDVLKKNPAVLSGTNDRGEPVIDTSMILGYYRWAMAEEKRGRRAGR